MDKDKLTTILGGALAAGTAAMPVINATQGSFKQSDWISLIMAVVFAISGWAQNKPVTPK